MDNSKVKEYYNEFKEKDRLDDLFGQIELARTQKLILDNVPKTSAVIYDIGGAAGRYSCWLSNMGYEVHLIDPVKRHIEQAKEAAQKCKVQGPESISIGDARKLPFEDSSANGVLLMGPLYHLTEKKDRLKALTEAKRVLKPGGKIFAVIISQFASSIDGLSSGFYKDPEFQKIVRGDLKNSRHINHTGNPMYFMDTYFQNPVEFIEELSESGFSKINLNAVEGIVWATKDLEKAWQDEAQRNFILEIIEKTQSDMSLIGSSPHILGIAIK